MQKLVSCSPRFLALSPDEASGLYDFLAFLTIRFGHVTVLQPRRSGINVIVCGGESMQKRTWATHGHEPILKIS